MKTHEMNLQPKYFDFMKDGTKRIELRLYDEKRSQIGLGDIIEFSKSENDKLKAEVIGLLRYNSFKDLFEDFDISILADASMTKEERMKPSIINPSRKKRIAAGSGTKVEDVNRLLKQFDQMQQLMKKFTGKNSKMNIRKARKKIAGMNFDKLTGKGGGNLPF